MSTQQKKYLSVVKNEGFTNGKQVERKTGDVLEHANTQGCLTKGSGFLSSVTECCSSKGTKICTSPLTSKGVCKTGYVNVCA